MYQLSLLSQKVPLENNNALKDDELASNDEVSLEEHDPMMRDHVFCDASVKSLTEASRSCCCKMHCEAFTKVSDIHFCSRVKYRFHGLQNLFF